VREETGPRWGRDSITYQYYELELAAAKSAIAAAHSVA
jgi:hypothetical protein